MRKLLSLLIAATLAVPAPIWAGVKSDKVQVIASTENPALREESGSLSFTQTKQFIFQSDSGKTLTIACSAITHTSYTAKSNTIKKIAVPAVAAALFTAGLSLLALAIRGHGHFLVINYGDGQQLILSMGKKVYTQDVNSTSDCTGKPTEILK